MSRLGSRDAGGGASFGSQQLWRSRTSLGASSVGPQGSEGGAAADWQIPPEDILICKDPYGRDWQLGTGGFGSVRTSPFLRLCWFSLCLFCADDAASKACMWLLTCLCAFPPVAYHLITQWRLRRVYHCRMSQRGTVHRTNSATRKDGLCAGVQGHLAVQHARGGQVRDGAQPQGARALPQRGRHPAGACLASWLPSPNSELHLNPGTLLTTLLQDFQVAMQLLRFPMPEAVKGFGQGAARLVQHFCNLGLADSHRPVLTMPACCPHARRACAT